VADSEFCNGWWKAKNEDREEAVPPHQKMFEILCRNNVYVKFSLGYKMHPVSKGMAAPTLPSSESRLQAHRASPK